MTLDSAALVTITESALANGETLAPLAGQVLAASETRGMIVVVSATHAEQCAMERRAAQAGPGTDAEQRAAIVTLAACESAQRFAGLLGLLGVDARLLDPLLFAPITRGSPLEAEPRLLHARRFEQASHEARVLVIAGGVGRSPEGRLTSLGSGGAVLSGLFIAQRLGLPSRIVVGEAAFAPFESEPLPRRAALFARKHGVHPEFTATAWDSPAGVRAAAPA
jgi:hypothetical protein